MTAPQEDRDRIARRWKRNGLPRMRVRSVCHTERGAERVARKYPGAVVERDGETWIVWEVARG